MTNKSEPQHLAAREQFDTEVTNSTGLVIVDIWAESCMPCRLLAPMLHKLAAEFDGSLRVAKLHVKDSEDIRALYKVTGWPTLLFFNDGQFVGKQVGYGGYKPLRAEVDSVIARLTGQPTPAPSEAEQAFVVAATAAEAALNASFELLGKPTDLAYRTAARPFNRNHAQTKRRIKKALAALRIDESEATRREERATATLMTKLAPAISAYHGAFAPAEATFVAAIESASGVFGTERGNDTGAAFCAIGDTTCRV